VLGGPLLDLWPKPEPGAATAEIDGGPRHVLIASLILADAVAVSETKDLGYIVGVDQIVDGNSPGHRGERTSIGGNPSTPVMVPSGPMNRIRV